MGGQQDKRQRPGKGREKQQRPQPRSDPARTRSTPSPAPPPAAASAPTRTNGAARKTRSRASASATRASERKRYPTHAEPGRACSHPEGPLSRRRWPGQALPTPYRAPQPEPGTAWPRAGGPGAPLSRPAPGC